MKWRYSSTLEYVVGWDPATSTSSWFAPAKMLSWKVLKPDPGITVYKLVVMWAIICARTMWCKAGLLCTRREIHLNKHAPSPISGIMDHWPELLLLPLLLSWSFSLSDGFVLLSLLLEESLVSICCLFSVSSIFPRALIPMFVADMVCCVHIVTFAWVVLLLYISLYRFRYCCMVTTVSIVRENSQ